MKHLEKKAFIDKSIKTLESIVDILENLPSFKLATLKSEDTALVIVDMVNGFAREGALKSDRIEGLIPNIVELIKLSQKRNIVNIAFLDSHTENCPEFENYPDHCMRGTSESELVDEIKGAGDYVLINKNSTNGFLEEEFKKWLEGNKNITNFILCGDCTDICILQFASTLKAYFNIQDRKSNIIVPMDVVETYDLDVHDADLMNLFSLYNMIGNGIKVVKTIEE
jgi:nicotinamidase-related amidase